MGKLGFYLINISSEKICYDNKIKQSLKPKIVLYKWVQSRYITNFYSEMIKDIECTILLQVGFNHHIRHYISRYLKHWIWRVSSFTKATIQFLKFLIETFSGRDRKAQYLITRFHLNYYSIVFDLTFLSNIRLLNYQHPP